MKFLVSPAERPPITGLGDISALCEKMGADILWQSPAGLAGVQRKALSDLISSVQDGRLGVELEQMQMLTAAFVVIEGWGQWTVEGEYMSRHQRWTLGQQRGIELAIQHKGIMVLHTRTAAETVTTMEQLWHWTQKPEHGTSLLRRPSAKANGWGRLTDRATAVHFLTGINGIGVELAQRIFDAFGRVPLTWDCTAEELAAVDGIGPKRVRSLMKVLSSVGPE